ncbi:conserved hypothetical protein [Renibacterium salmoninarum ATCC 33209]|uniref:Uncharacterized protein n=1 Tax=Renibacterium salmoninarum (strain ATCC 33209 / DSM 20767 / JCM 11484 / NBRC 15589 / NCIMB 2235) TaxID=288705 RepID=A9WU62_RENSM|nr:hypothetical protein [Renibacterium salmoninarum]ABY24733.1 conserved hypothetical protein [Renibacterium salmoninarum ATCC 33209]
MSHLQKELLSILRCPVTGSRLQQGQHELVSDSPGPEGVPLHYRIEDGIAILLPGQLPENDAPSQQTSNIKA